MKSSFGGGSRGMGGGNGGGGGGMLRTLQRAVRAGVGGASQDPFSHSTNNNTTATSTRRKSNHPLDRRLNTLSLSSTSAALSPLNLPVSASFSTATAWPCSPTYSSEDSEWEHVERSQEEIRGFGGFSDDSVFGSVPSAEEVHHAVSALQLVLTPTAFPNYFKDRASYSSEENVEDDMTSLDGSVDAVESVSDWIEPSLHLYNSRMLQPRGSVRVYDAFHLLQTDPAVQRMVISLSSDRAVWDAVLNNEVVRELRETLTQGTSLPGSTDKGSDDSNPVVDMLSWIFVNTKAKIIELIKAKIMELSDKITQLMNELFQPSENDKLVKETPDPLENKLRTSLMLSVVVLLVIVVTRAFSNSTT